MKCVKESKVMKRVVTVSLFVVFFSLSLRAEAPHSDTAQKPTEAVQSASSTPSSSESKPSPSIAAQKPVCDPLREGTTGSTVAIDKASGK